MAWIEKYGDDLLRPGSVLLLGGTSVLDFRLRVAQCHIRNDLLPSYWSHVAIVREKREGAWRLSEVSLDPAKGFGTFTNTTPSRTPT